jgi:hypothetical protein
MEAMNGLLLYVGVGALLVVLVTLWVGYLIGRAVAGARFHREIPAVREDAVKRSPAPSSAGS